MASRAAILVAGHEREGMLRALSWPISME